MFWIVILLILAAITAGYLVGWSRGHRGLARWPFTVGQDGIHRQPILLLCLLTAASGSLVACTAEYRAPAPAPDTTAAAPRDSDAHHAKRKDHDKRKPPHGEETKP